MYVVMPSIRLDGTSAIPTHRARVLQARDGTITRAGADRAKRAAAPCDDQAAETEQREEHVADRPESSLLIERQQWLDQERVREQREQAACVSGGVQEVRIASGGVPARGQPVLEQGARRRHDEEGRTDCDGEHAEQPQRGRRVRGRRREPAANRQCGYRQYEHDGVNDRLPRGTEQTRRCVRIAVTGKQNRLEEKHRGSPDSLRATEERQDHPSNHRLHEKDERRAGKDRGREDPERGPVGKAGRQRRGDDLGGGQVHKGTIGRPGSGLNLGYEIDPIAGRNGWLAAVLELAAMCDQRLLESVEACRHRFWCVGVERPVFESAEENSFGTSCEKDGHRRARLFEPEAKRGGFLDVFEPLL